MHARLIALALLPACAAAPETGPAVEITPEPEPAAEAVLVVDGVERDIAVAHVYGLDNENTHYQVFLASTPLDPAPPEPVAGTLRVGDVVRTSSSWGTGPEGARYFGFEASPDEVGTFARALGVPARPRVHPGHRFAAALRPRAETYAAGGPVLVDFVLENTGDVPFSYMKGGRYRNASGRDNRFTFTITRDGQVEPDIGPEFDFGGLATLLELAPGESDTIEVDLAQWCAFDGPGRYEVRGAYELALGHWGDPGEHPVAQAHRSWDDVARASVAIEIR